MLAGARSSARYTFGYIRFDVSALGDEGVYDELLLAAT